LTGRHSQSSLN